MRKTTPEIRKDNFAAEVKKAGGPKAFSETFGENIDYVRQMLNGKNIGNSKARRLETLLRKGHGWMDHDWSQAPEPIPGEGSPSAGADERSQSLITNQLENDIDSIRYAVASLYSAMAFERPAEGARLAAKIRQEVPAKFVDQGFLKLLLVALDKAAKRAKIPPAAPSS